LSHTSNEIALYAGEIRIELPPVNRIQLAVLVEIEDGLARYLFNYTPELRQEAVAVQVDSPCFPVCLVSVLFEFLHEIRLRPPPAGSASSLHGP
jgi:hypothetical protein